LSFFAIITTNKRKKDKFSIQITMPTTVNDYNIYTLPLLLWFLSRAIHTHTHENPEREK